MRTFSVTYFSICSEKVRIEKILGDILMLVKLMKINLVKI